MTTKRSELINKCKELELKNYRNLKKCDLQNLIDTVREGKELPEKYYGEKKKRNRKLILYNDSENIENGYTFYNSINEAAKTIGVKPMQIYKMIAEGRGMFFTKTLRRVPLHTTFVT